MNIRDLLITDLQIDSLTSLFVCVIQDSLNDIDFRILFYD